MARLSRSQLLVYGAVGVALLLVGARWIRSSTGQSSARSGVDVAATDPAGGSSGAPLTVASEGDGDVVVHVTGAVRRSGVYRLPAGSRVTDAVQRAGGANSRANLEGINLAARLSDGQQVVVPERVRAGGTAPTSAGTTATDPDAPVSLGTATLEQLDTIESIGPVTAQNILDYRDEHGGVSSIDQLDEIDGIGPATMEALRARLQP